MTASIEETIAEAGIAAPRQPRLRLLRSYLRRPLGVAAAVFLLLVIIAVCLAPVIAPYNPLGQDLTATLQTPSRAHLLGTDRLGRDVLSRLLWGGRLSLLGLVEALAVAVILGIIFGLIAGYSGRFTDNAVSRATEIVMAVPGIVVLLMIYTITNNNAAAGMVTLGVLSSPTIIRVTRAATMAVREEIFIASAKVIGLGRVRIVLSHVLPNIWGPIIVNTAVLGAVILGIQGGLNYINLGVNPPNPSWGSMVSDAQQVMAEQAWLIVPSGVTLGLVILSLILVADGLRDATASKRSRVITARPKPPATAGPAPSAAPDPGAILSVRALSVSFGGLQVVKEVSFDVQPGETLGIIGESGCGKTVTASAVLNSLGPGSEVAGAVFFRGEDITRAAKKARAAIRGSGIGYVSQDPMVALDPCFTVANQLGELVGRHDHTRGARRRERALELLGQVGLPEPADVARRFPHQLSGGMAQRVAIACALAGRPQVLIADEPTSALDVTVQGEILGLLRRLQSDTGMAIVLITHDLGVVADLCTRAVVMYAGEVVENADAVTLFAAPAHPYTKALLESNPIMGRPRTTLRSIPGTVPSPAMWPPGCHFYDRCPVHIAACASAPVPLEPLDAGSGHAARCIRVGTRAVSDRVNGKIA
jgi:oligopeptide/dipeptide ABC transporter ATP-binding protein